MGGPPPPMVSPSRSTNWASDVWTNPWAVRTPGTAATWSVTDSEMRPALAELLSADSPPTRRSTPVRVWANTALNDRLTESVST